MRINGAFDRFVSSVKSADPDKRALQVAIAVAFSFGGVAYLAAAFAKNSEGIATIWPANGIVLAALIATPRNDRRLMYLGFAFLANIIANTLAHRPLIANIGFSIANSLEICIALAILEVREGRIAEFRNLRFFASFAMAALVASSVSAVAAASLAALTSAAVSWRVFSCWLFADLIGLLTVTPALLRLRQGRDIADAGQSAAESYGLLCLLTVIMALVVGLPQPLLAFLVIPTLVLIACRLGPNSTAVAALLMSAVVLLCAAFGLGRNASIDTMAMLTDVQLTQLLVLTAYMTVMPLAETLASQARLQGQLSTEIGLRDELNKHLRAQEQTMSEQKAELEKAHNRLKEAIDILPEGIVILDADNRYVAWNKRYAEIYHRAVDTIVVGRSLEEALRIGLARGMYPEAMGREEAWLAERLKNLKTPAAPHEQLLDDGRCYLIEERRTSEGGLISLRVDITEMKRRESSLRLLFENNPLPMFVVSRANMAIRAVNNAAVAHYGYSRAISLSIAARDSARRSGPAVPKRYGVFEID